MEEGLRSVAASRRAAPVRGRDGEVVAAVNIPVHAGRTPVEAVRRDPLRRPGPAGRPSAAATAATGRAPAVNPGSGTHR
ncbi:hypothetical protein [Streptomyces sp. MB09-02B]|uniref:hypothetical protein n=1 Tax=Streptomyces sp. MB09-02B TaxID=3028667 RepID=UPI0029ACD79D|nr:hypothetical protein [Streptomyces sp. MB09-02B]MDX3640272.1 hypothetical protein [Streptomyces sp. MB09-02B]